MRLVSFGRRYRFTALVQLQHLLFCGRCRSERTAVAAPVIRVLLLDDPASLITGTIANGSELALIEGTFGAVDRKRVLACHQITMIFSSSSSVMGCPAKSNLAQMLPGMPLPKAQATIVCHA